LPDAAVHHHRRAGRRQDDDPDGAPGPRIRRGRRGGHRRQRPSASLGRHEPWRDPGFIDSITLLQRQRLVQPAPPATAVQVFDRSPICTLALARYLGLPSTPLLDKEIQRAVAEGIYQPRVFFVHLLGFITRTAVRRISLAQSVTFERFHQQAYRNHGFELLDVPAGTVEERVELIDGAWAE
jgi:predicted ATPase